MTLPGSKHHSASPYGSQLRTFLLKPHSGISREGNHTAAYRRPKGDAPNFLVQREPKRTEVRIRTHGIPPDADDRLMVGVLILCAVLGVVAIVLAGLGRDGHRQREEGLAERTPAVAASEKRTAGHVWLSVAVIAAILLVGTIRNAGKMPEIIAACITVLEIGLVAWCGVQAFFAYRAAHRVDR